MIYSCAINIFEQPHLRYHLILLDCYILILAMANRTMSSSPPPDDSHRVEDDHDTLQFLAEMLGQKLPTAEFCWPNLASDMFRDPDISVSYLAYYLGDMWIYCCSSHRSCLVG